MSLYRRRVFFYCFVFLLAIFQISIYIHHSPKSSCKENVRITIPANVSDMENIINLNTKILCWIPTTIQRLDRAVVVHETWASRCDRSIFIIAGQSSTKLFDQDKYSFPIAFIGNATIEKYNKLSDKVLLALLHIYENYVHDYDWFFKADDDTYVIVENLRHLLRRRPSNISFCFGYVAKTPDRFYPSGGAGYVLSQEALLQFGEKILTKPEKRKLCNTDEAEDVNLAYCLAKVNIFVTNARDDNQLETFHPMTFEQHFIGNFTKWIEKNAQFEQKKGEQCCSPLSITFHSLSPMEIRMMHFLLYHIQKAPI